jgi:hypothetical protein
VTNKESQLFLMADKEFPLNVFMCKKVLYIFIVHSFLLNVVAIFLASSL